MVIVAFATVYVVWGSTYFFIQVAVQYFPPMILGAFRFLAAGILLLGWCLFKGEQPGTWQQVKTAIISGLMLLLGGTGAVIWAEKWLPSSMVAVLISSSPFWFIILDVPKWRENFTSRSIIAGLIFGFVGVVLMFGEKVADGVSGWWNDYRLCLGRRRRRRRNNYSVQFRPRLHSGNCAKVKKSRTLGLLCQSGFH